MWSWVERSMSLFRENQNYHVGIGIYLFSLEMFPLFPAAVPMVGTLIHTKYTMMTSPCCFIYSPPAIFRATARWYNTSNCAASSFEFSPFSLNSDSPHLLDGGFYTPTPDAVVRGPISPIADMMQRSMSVEFTKELTASLAKRLDVDEAAGGAAADAEVEAEAEGEAEAENERHQDDGAAAAGAEAKTAVAVSSSVDRELLGAQERKTHIKFYFLLQVLTEMADQINFELGRTPCDRSSPVLKWKDLVGHPKKKQGNNRDFNLSVADLFNRTQTAIDLRLSEAEAAKMVKRIQVRIRSYRSDFKNCPNKIPDWKKSLLCEFPKSHRIKIF